MAHPHEGKVSTLSLVTYLTYLSTRATQPKHAGLDGAHKKGKDKRMTLLSTIFGMPSAPDAPALTAIWPRLRFASGGEAGFRGRPGRLYNLLSAPRFSLALRVTPVESTAPGSHAARASGTCGTGAP